MKKLCVLLRIKFYSGNYDTKIIYFDEGVLILWPFFWGNVNFNFRQCRLKSHNWHIQKSKLTYRKFAIVLFFRVNCLLLLWKTKTAWIKRSIHYVTLQCHNPGEATHRFSSLPQSRRLIRNKQFWKWHRLRKMALKTERLHQNHWSWCHFAERKRIFYALMHSLTNLI